jgi:hypothetical protein
LALGECLLEQGEDQAAAHAFQSALKYAPEDTAARRYLEQLGGK